MALIEKEWLEDLLLAHEQNARSIEASGRKVSFTYADGIRTAYADVGLCPSVDAVVVVRCKDCKHFHYDIPYVIQGIPIRGHGVCDFWGYGNKTSENGFCSYAERRTECLITL